METRIILIIALIISLILNLGLIPAVIVISLKKTSKCDSPSQLQDQHHAETRIIGGKRVDVNKHKYVAAILEDIYGAYVFRCSTVIIHKHFTITTAHCLEKLIREGRFGPGLVVRSGTTNWQENGNDHNIERMGVHDNYIFEIDVNNLGVVRVVEPFVGALEKPIHIVSNKYQYRINTIATVVGWAVRQSSMGEGVVSQALYEMNVTLISRNYCNKLYKGIKDMKPTMFCAYYKGKKDTCMFDEGGPIMQHGLLIGLIVSEELCKAKHYPGLYVQVPMFQQWLLKKIKTMSA